jgi:hypothetical protein
MNRTRQVVGGQSRTRKTGLDNQSRTGRAGQDAEKDSTGRAGQDSGQDRTGRAQVSRSDDLDLDLVGFLELKTNQSGSGFI